MNIVDPLHQHAQTMPSGTALIFPSGRLSWNQLDTLVMRFAYKLSRKGVKQGDLVCLAFIHPLLHLVTALGLAKIGAIQTSLPPKDSSMTRKQLYNFLGIDTVITDEPNADYFSLHVIGMQQLPSEIHDSAAREKQYSVQENDPWLFLKSSGTTGEPKYAQLTHKISLERFARWSDAYDYTKSDVFWIGISMDTITGKQHTISALQAGTTVCMPIGIADYAGLVEFLRSCGTTLAYDIPSHLWELVETSDGSPILPNIRRFFSGTTETSENLRQQFIAKVTPNFFTNYGTNEAPCITVASPSNLIKKERTVGIVHRLIELQIVDDKDNELEPGTTGHIRLRGPGIISEYYRNQEETLRAFRSGWFYPGDLAYIDADDQVVLQGRRDEMIICDGINIYPLEIERVLCAHPQIDEAVVFSVNHERLQQVPIAALIAEPTIDLQELALWAEARLGRQRPHQLLTVSTFPRNSSGKIIRKKLEKMYERTIEALNKKTMG